MQICDRVTYLQFKFGDERWSELIIHMLYYRKFINCSNTAETMQKNLLKISLRIFLESTGNLLEIDFYTSDHHLHDVLFPQPVDCCWCFFVPRLRLHLAA